MANGFNIIYIIYLQHIIYQIIFPRIAVISIIAIRRMRVITMKRLQPRLDLTPSQLELTHYSLPSKMPWIKC